MDPDACLIEAISLAAKLAARFDRGQTIDQVDAARLAELVQSLDGWILGGGFLPARWELPRRRLGVGR